jgi:hypothetical protein
VGRACKETRGRIIFANNSERSDVENVFRDISMEPAQGALFHLVESINKAVIELNIELSNEIFEAQSNTFLSKLDKIDMTLIDLIPSEITTEEIERHVEQVIERTLAYQYCDTDGLKDRIKEVFTIRTKNLQTEVPRESWSILKRSGSSPRYWKFVNDLTLLERSEWQTLNSVNDIDWLEKVVLKIVEMPTLEIEGDITILSKAINGWMNGFSYEEIAQFCDIEIDDALKLLGHTIGYQLQDGLAKLSQLAIAHHGEDSLSEVAINWASLLQYGLGDMQQLDLFERGGSDRLGVWGISRYLKEANTAFRERELLNYLRQNPDDIIAFLDMDYRVPKLSAKRICKELRIIAV